MQFSGREYILGQVVFVFSLNFGLVFYCYVNWGKLFFFLQNKNDIIYFVRGVVRIKLDYFYNLLGMCVK